MTQAYPTYGKGGGKRERHPPFSLRRGLMSPRIQHAAIGRRLQHMLLPAAGRATV
ncbi:UNVERIFIED_ORG: hypothetical protein J2Y78_000752 [Buttiauxella agrestis ATCC 33320]